MPEEKPWTGIAHYPPDLLPPVLPVTVDGTMGAGPLPLPVGTFFHPFRTVGQKVPALFAKTNRIVMMFPAVQTDEMLQSTNLSFSGIDGNSTSNHFTVFRSGFQSRTGVIL